MLAKVANRETQTVVDALIRQASLTASQNEMAAA
jgi:hypothetical protein